MKILTTIITLFWISLSFGQIEDPVKWTSNIIKVSETEYDLVFKATIEKNWHLYSSFNPEGASLPIEFESEQMGETFDFVGRPKESKTHKEYSKTWGKEEIFFIQNATITQRIKIKNLKVKTIEVILYGQACKESCIQIEHDFEFDLTSFTL